MIRVRIDDFPHTKDSEKGRHTLAAFREFHRVLSECIGGKRYLLGVIPKRCSVEDVLFLQRETDCEIGMHGIFHDEEKLDLWKGEFPPYLSQREICRVLQETANALDSAIGRRTEIYMPPRNLIDRKTVDVLMDAGFLAYTGGPETPLELRRATDDGVQYIHSEPPHEYGRTDEMYQRGSHLELQKFENRNAILTLHWTWETNIGLDHMKKFFEAIPKNMFGDFE